MIIWKTNCAHYIEETHADNSWGYFGQGDYHLSPSCKINKEVEREDNPDIWHKWACPVYCPSYEFKEEKDGSTGTD